ncbi:MAG: hypothetical protein AAF184_00930 [Pseudomonadota bacterium]
MKTLPALSLLLFSSLALAAGESTGPVFVLEFTDGTVLERPLNQSRHPVAERIDEGEPVLTFDTEIIVLSDSGRRDLVVVRRGQRVGIGIEFNPLDTLGVPFEELIGRELLLKVIAPRLGFQYDIPFLITEDFSGLMSIRASYTVPEDAEVGSFGIAARNGIEGYVSLNARAREIRFVVE